MTTLREAAQQALEALENCGGVTKADAIQRVAAITALKAALAEPNDPVAYDGWVLREVLFDNGEPLGHREPVAWTEGHCIEKRKPGGCQLHNINCGYPACDRRPTHPLQCTKTNQGGETCERAKLCPACLTAL